MKFAFSLVIGVALCAAFARADYFPPIVKFINADQISMSSGVQPPTRINATFEYVASTGMSTLRMVFNFGESGKYIAWTLLAESPNGEIVLVAQYSQRANGTCAQDSASRILWANCSKWKKTAGPGERSSWTRQCNSLLIPNTDFTFIAVTNKAQLLSLTTKSAASSDVILIDHQYPRPPSSSNMQPCTPNLPLQAGLMLPEGASHSGVHPLGGLLGGLKCGACKLGIGVILGRLCGAGGAAVCAAFPPAIPFCAILSQAACKSGGKLGSDQGCKIIKMC